MRELGFISDEQYQAALKEPMRISTARQEFGTHAEYVAELVRQQVLAEFKDDAYTRGLVVVTTIRKAEQDAAYDSVRRNVLAYDQRHGYRGPEAFIELPATPDEREDAINDSCARVVSDGLIPVVVTAVTPTLVTVENLNGDRIEIGAAGLKLALAAGRECQTGAAPAPRRGGAHRPGRKKLGHRPGAAGGRRVCGDRFGQRRLPCAGGRLRLQSAEVQPCDPGPAPARLLDEALHLFVGDRARLFAGHPDPRRAARSSRAAVRMAAPGHPRTTTASTTARSACARRSPIRRTCRRCGCCARSASPTPTPS
ncbi:hypothetical protein LP420_01095 [Massilia sp. B-10]|nr:hypothetical protein LP420_01095 [Massilia sp. B-10]